MDRIEITIEQDGAMFIQVQKPDNERKKDTMALDPPNYRTAMKAFRLCVQHYGRLPQELVADRSPGSGKKSSDLDEWLDMREVVGGERK